MGMRIPDREDTEKSGPEGNNQIRQLIDDGCKAIDKETYNTIKNEEAENFFKQALQHDPKNKRALNGLGMAQSLQKKWLSAIATYQKVLDQYSQTAVPSAEIKEYTYALKGTAYCYLNQGKFSEALVLLNQYTELRPEKPRGWFNKGFVLFSLGEYKESERCFQKFLEIEPIGSKYRLDALNFLGFIAYNVDDLRKAETLFNQATSENPFSFGAQITQKLVQDKKFYFQQQQELIEKAETYLTQLLEDFRNGLKIVQYMFIIQFLAGIGLLVYALFLYSTGKDAVLTYIAGVSGGLIAILSLVFTAPSDLQKNRVDFSQWMIAYFNWINTVYAVRGAINQKTANNKEINWQEIQPLQSYLTQVTKETITTLEQCCEFSKKSNISIPGLNVGGGAEKDAGEEKSTEVKQQGQSQNASVAAKPKDEVSATEEKKS
jgi:tetratricopeptide (TPR) repeat protein